MVPRKSPNRTMMPYSSTRKPINGHRIRMSARPPKNAAVPLALFFLAKKRRVFWGPMMIVKPMRKRTWLGDEALAGRHIQRHSSGGCLRAALHFPWLALPDQRITARLLSGRSLLSTIHVRIRKLLSLRQSSKGRVRKRTYRQSRRQLQFLQANLVSMLLCFLLKNMWMGGCLSVLWESDNHMVGIFAILKWAVR